jgi:hypothetical protein
LSKENKNIYLPTTNHFMLQAIQRCASYSLHIFSASATAGVLEEQEAAATPAVGSTAQAPEIYPFNV